MGTMTTQCVNAAVEINIVDYGVTVHCRTSTYGEFVTRYGLHQIRVRVLDIALRA